MLFLMTLYHQKKIFNDIFFPFVLSSLTEGSLSLAGGLCERDAAEQTSLILPRYRRRFDKPGKPSVSSKGLSGNPALAAFGNSRRTSVSSHRALPASSDAVPCRGCATFPGWSLPSAPSPAGAVRAALQKSRWDPGERGQVPPGSRLRVLRSPRRAKRRGFRPWGAARRVAFWMSSSAKNVLASFFFFFILTLLA